MQPSEVKTAAHARKIVEERKLSHVKVGVFDVDGVLRGKYLEPREVLLRARERLRLLRRGARLGLQRPALRQCQLHRLAHRLSGRAVRIVPDDLPRAAARRRHAVLPRRVRRRGRGDLPARHAAARAQARRRTWATRRQAPAEYEFFLFEETPHSVREKGYREPARPSRPASSAIRCCAPRCMRSSTTHLLELCDDDAHAARRAAHRDRPGRAGSGHHLCGRARRRRPRRPVQDLHQGPGRSGAAGWRPSWRSGRATGRASPATCTSRSRTRSGKPVFHDAEQAARACPTRCAGSSAASRR